MIKLFRKIRQKLLTDNKFSKYLLYAFGEIVLVVIGILIALSINNWNEYRKERVTEKRYLKEIISTLEMNVKLFGQYSNKMRVSNESKDIILSHMINHISISDSLDKHFNRAARIEGYTFYSIAGFEELKNVGLHIIQNEALKREIVNLFENEYPKMKQFINLFPGSEDLDKYLIENFERSNDPENFFFRPINYEELMNDHFYKQSLIERGKQRRWFLGIYTENIEQSNKIINLIKEELDNLGN